VSNDDTILDLIDDISDVNSVNVEEFMEQSEKRQGKGQDNIQSNHQDENNNYAEDDIISISSDDEMINDERGLEVSDMKTLKKSSKSVFTYYLFVCAIGFNVTFYILYGKFHDDQLFIWRRKPEHPEETADLRQ